MPINERVCITCNKLGDEFHFLFECILFTGERRRFLKPYYYNRPNVIKTHELMNNKNKQESLKLCKFIKCILNRV